ncbi:altered inheritance of mitochondria protein 32-like [Bidens hawaiensis]|uniref:altered inheritance of mitochondria protein 32-like n=1 Tax=Bidens hawaiensis TaxID=980011 RepID=UPI00404A7C59
MASNIDETLLLSPEVVSETESYSSGRSGSADGSFRSDGFLGGDDELRQRPVEGTVDYSERYVFLCYKKPQVWPPHIEAAEFDRLPRLLSAAIASRKIDMKKQTRLTMCEGHDGTESSNGDILIFPDMIRYRRLTHFDVDTFVEEVLVKEGEWLPGNPESLTGTFIFVCAHGSRDQRCGVRGPAVIARFRTEIVSRGLQTKVSVRPCSHIGGHKYARNVIIFGSNDRGKVTGHWYGYVMPDDVPTLLEHHVEKGEFVDRLWRGQKRLSENNQNNGNELTVIANGANNSIDDVCDPMEHGGCCNSPPIAPEDPTNIKCATSQKKKGIKNHITSNMSNKAGPTTHKVYNMPTWLETWEREDIYATLALIGAALSVAVAYNCYRQLG